MPTNDTPAPPPRPSRRTLGRGPGSAPPGTGPDRSTTPPPSPPPSPPPPQEAPQRPAPPPAADTVDEGTEEPQNAAQTAQEAPAEPPGAPETPAAPEAPVAPEAHQAAAEPDSREAVAEPEAPEATAGPEAAEVAVEPEVPEAASEERNAPDAESEPSPATAEAVAPAERRGAGGGRGRKGASADEPEPVHARADPDAAPPVGGHGGEAAGAGDDGADACAGADMSGGTDAGAGAESGAGAGPSSGADTKSGAQASSGAEAGDGAGAGAEAGEVEVEDGGNRFTVRLDNFEGPFDLLLQLISKHKLDVTEVALSKVTDEFMAHIRAMGPDWDLDQTTEFLVVAATLLDLKAARLLPAAEVEDEADLALLEARDLLFARLLQYRAYKQIADIFNDRLIAEAARHPRTVGLEPHHAELLPDVVISIGPEGFAKLAVKAMQPKPKPQVYVDHIHTPLVSVREQAEVVVARLRELGEATFAALTEDAPDVLTVVARFLSLLELYRERAVLLEQPEALGQLMVRWTGGAGQRPLVTDEFDQEAKPRKEPEKETAAAEKEKEEVAS
ncbi:segregation/condensation protein A [Streptomyces antioxidans]|uniref:Segregation and condensation protein A n=1 Tax=Streptomyces antioxidans TaxID=1507734 RepID=A0A1V4CX06_9ACTN|nr:segregation/condensation protein A [Streptomyces antioxidans]OPF72311.1 segregation/condensation protein A [Streptomyces antioxidans]